MCLKRLSCVCRKEAGQNDSLPLIKLAEKMCCLSEGIDKAKGDLVNIIHYDDQPYGCRKLCCLKIHCCQAITTKVLPLVLPASSRKQIQ